MQSLFFNACASYQKLLKTTLWQYMLYNMLLL